MDIVDAMKLYSAAVYLLMICNSCEVEPSSFHKAFVAALFKLSTGAVGWQWKKL